MHYLPDVAIFALVLIALFVCGTIPLFPDSKSLALENLVLGVAATLGVWSLTVWVCGQFSLVGLGVYGVALLMPLSIGGLANRGRVGAHFHAIIRFIRNLRGLDLTLALYLFAVFALTFVLTLAPPNGADYDSLTYHLAAPAQYLRGGRIRELPYDHHSYFPFSMEMLYLLGLQLRGPVLAKLFHWLMMVLSCGALLAMGRRHLSQRAGFLAAALFASLPLVQAEASTAYADLGLTAYTLIAFACFANWLQKRDAQTVEASISAVSSAHGEAETAKRAKNKRAKAERKTEVREAAEPRDEPQTDAGDVASKGARDARWLIWSGVFCGFCLGVKYLGVLTFGWLLLWAIGRMARAKSFQVKPLLLFSVATLLLGGGWYVRNWIWTGNPVFPFAYEIFGGRGWNADMAKAYSVDQARYGFGRGLLDWLWMPWRVSMSPLNLGVVPPQQVVGLPFWPLPSEPLQDGFHSGTFEVPVVDMLFQSVIGPALLALGAPLLLVQRKPPLIRFIGWSMAFFAVFWAATSQQIRYLMPPLALLCLICGWGAQKYLGRTAMLKWTCALGLCAWLLFSPAFTLWKARTMLPVVAGTTSPHEYLTRTFSGYAAMHRASIETPPNSRFAVYGEPRCFYLERDYFWADDPHNNLIDYNRIKTGADFVRALRERKATHVLQNLDPGANGGFGIAPPQMEAAVQSGQLKLLFEERGYRVYEIVGGATR